MRFFKFFRAHLAHGKYTLRHKWYVFKGCCHAARVSGMMSLYWRGIIHDRSKFTAPEWNAYVYNFFNADGSRIAKVQRAVGGYDPNDQPLEFRYAFLNHQKVNKHHWQAWCSLGDGGSLNPMPIPCVYLWEMVADWFGAGMALGNLGEEGPRRWYNANKSTLVLEDATRDMLEHIMDRFWEEYKTK